MTERGARHHVMHLVDSLGVGGMENGVVNLANRLDRDRFRFSVCCLSHPGKLSERIESGASVVSLGWQGGFAPRLFTELARLFREQRVDIVHTHGWLTLLYGSVAAVLAGSPVVINGEHGTFNLDRKRRRLVYRALSLLVHRYVAVSYSLQRALVDNFGIGSRKIAVIPNGVDLARFAPLSGEEVEELKRELGIPPAGMVIGSVGRLEPVKNFEMFLRVFSLLAQKKPDLQLVLIGDGASRPALEELARSLGIERRVHFTGRVENPHRVGAILDIFVSTSFSEGMSNTILEAMACAKPIVATDVGDSGRLVREGENGFLLPSGDETALKTLLEKLLGDSALRDRFGARSREIAEESYGIAGMIGQYQEIYLNALGKGEGR